MSARRIGLGVAAVATSVGLYALAFPPTRGRPLAWVSLVPLLWAARATGPGGAFGLGIAWNLAVAFVVVDALPDGLAAYLEQPVWVAWLLAALVFTVNSTVHYGAALALYRALARRYSVALPLLCGAAWAAAELARARLLTPVPGLVGTPVVIAGASQVGWDTFIQLAALTGQYGLSFLVVSANAAAVELLLAARARARLPGALSGAAVVLALVCVALGYGAWVLHTQPGEPGERGEPIPVVVVQANLDPGESWDPANYGRNLDSYLRLTLSSFDVTRPRVVFWPEGSMTFPVQEAQHFRDLLARVLSAADAELVAGGPRMGPGEVPRPYNSAFLIAPSGEPQAHYDKQYLLPFVEFEPFAGLDLLRRSFGPFRYWVPGGETKPLPTGAGPAGVLICNEALLPQLAVQRVRAGATFLLTPANDAWLAGGWTPWPKWGWLMLDEAALRAVEVRRPLIRASTSGPSAVVDAWGRIRRSTAPETAAILVAGLRPRSDLTLYARIGDGFGVLCAVLALGALLRRPTSPAPRLPGGRYTRRA